MALFTGALIGVACSRQEAADMPQGPADGKATYAYLGIVGRLRDPVNADNKMTIPAIIRGADIATLRNEASKMAKVEQDLAKVPTARVDPDAIQFVTNFNAIVGAYKAVCADTAELYIEVAHRDSVAPASPTLMGSLRSSLAAVQPDTIGAANALLDAVAQLAPFPQGSGSLDPIVATLRNDVQVLVSAKEAHHAFIAKAQAGFAQKYPTLDWGAKEIL